MKPTLPDEPSLPLTSADVTAAMLVALRELLPAAFTEGKLDVGRLQQLLGDAAASGPERYGLTWAGKSDAIRAIQSLSRGTLVPALDESVHFDTSENLILEGDNLEILKLLQKSYHGQVKMIYIDPPYNTGNEFIYPDNFREGLADYLKYSGQVSGEGLKMTVNAETGGRYHSNWLTMMYPRLFLARNLLQEDGVIFVSIDDHEVHNLRLLLNEIFGEESFVGCVVWERKRKGSHLSKKLTQKTEYILVYSRIDASVELYGEPVGLDEDGPLIKRTNTVKTLVIPAGVIETSLPDGIYDAGIYGKGSSSVELIEPIEVSKGRFVSETKLNGPFVWSQVKVNEEIESGGRFFIRTSNFSLRALKADQASGFKALSSLLTKDVGTNEDAKTELANLFNVSEEDIPLEYPKPTSLIRILLRSATFHQSNSIILDFFAGSGTTAQAVLELNKEDAGQRKFILAQLPEPTSNPGFPTIAEITKERVRRVISRMSANATPPPPPTCIPAYTFCRRRASRSRLAHAA